MGTGLPAQHEVFGLLYVLHYLNRAIITPLFIAPSMSPIHVKITVAMTIFQWLNSSNLASWIAYSSQQGRGLTGSLTDPLAIVGLALFVIGLTGNVVAENTLFGLRRGAAKRRAKSEGKAKVTYDKVYVIPPAEGVFSYVLYPHYSLEWLEWTGYWILGGAIGLGWGNGSAALWFLIDELSSMSPRAYDGVNWYDGKFGKRAVAGRKAVIPFVL